MLQGLFNTIGTIAGGVGQAGGAVLSGAGQLAGGVAKAAWEAPGAIYGAGEKVIKQLPEIAEKSQPIAEVLGGVYGAYTSYENLRNRLGFSTSKTSSSCRVRPSANINFTRPVTKC